jgi:hypothetical protein
MRLPRKITAVVIIIIIILMPCIVATQLHIAMGRLQQEQGTAAPDASLIPEMLLQTLIQATTENIVQFFQPDALESRIICADEMLYNTFLSIQTPPPKA